MSGSSTAFAATSKKKNNGKVELLAMTRQKMSEANDSFFLSKSPYAT